MDEAGAGVHYVGAKPSGIDLPATLTNMGIKSLNGCTLGCGQIWTQRLCEQRRDVVQRGASWWHESPQVQTQAM